MHRVNFVKQVLQISIVIFFLFLFSTICSAAKITDTANSRQWATIDGFRSAKFGFNESSIFRAIKKDFQINKKAVSRGKNSSEKTTFLMIDVKDLFVGSGPSKVVYIFGFKSKKLIQVKVVWGRPAQKKPDVEKIVSVATQLSNYFSQKIYQKNGFVSHKKISEGIILVFQGRDKKGRTARLLLSNPKNKDDKAGENITLTLAYIEKPEDPDVFKIKDGDF
ncbi:MAG: hypothetical protein HOB32_11035 [Nitrospina sp.]|jgi:hypothetical protein|nr:hypothetical protein [Nitrospina sp.]MBT6602168.1 hypothetical protein [Nitrospina sp.]